MTDNHHKDTTSNLAQDKRPKLTCSTPAVLAVVMIAVFSHHPIGSCMSLYIYIQVILRTVHQTLAKLNYSTYTV